MRTGITRRKYWADAFHEIMPQLERAFLKEGRGRHCGLFLQREIVRHADEDTLARIVDDMKHELLDIEHPRSPDTPTGLAVETRVRTDS